MPNIFDNIEKNLLDGLKHALDVARQGDFCVGYFNLRGWKQVADNIDRWAGGKGGSMEFIPPKAGASRRRSWILLSTTISSIGWEKSWGGRNKDR